MDHTVADVPFPHIDGEIDDLKALKFAHGLCQLVASAQSGWGGMHADADRAAAALAGLIDTAEGFEESQVRRFEFLETMLNKDGLAVVIYLEADGVRSSLVGKQHPQLAKQITDEEIGQVLQDIAQNGATPAIMESWSTEMEALAADRIVEMKALAEETGG